MKVYGGMDAYTHVLLTLAPAGGQWSAPNPGRFILGEVPRTHGYEAEPPPPPTEPVWTMDRTQKIFPLSGLEFQPLEHPVHSSRYTD
jgi:hypothetical protein